GTAAAQAAGALAAATEAVQREAPHEVQLRQQLIRIGGLLAQAEQLQVETLDRQRALADAELAAEQELAALEPRVQEGSASLGDLVQRRQEAELRGALARQRSDDLVRQLERAQQVLRAHGDELAQRRAAEAAQAEVDRCTQALREGGQEIEDDSVTIEEVDWQKTEREVSRLQRRLDAMGAVNLLAPEEYAQVRDRCESLAAQLGDLEAASAQ